MFEGQNNKCAICKKEGTKKLSVDHCHKTGKVRKLLCKNCNTMLGLAKESVKTLQEAISYLKEFDYDNSRE